MESSLNDNQPPAVPAARSGRRFDLLAAAPLLASNLLLAGPFLVAWNNPAEMIFGFSSLVTRLLPAFLIVTAGLCLVGWALPARAYRIYLGLLFALALLTWLQPAAFMANYGVFDGRGLNWAAASWRGWIDVPVWIVTALLVVRMGSRWREGLRWACLVLLVTVPLVPVLTTMAAGDRSWGSFWRGPGEPSVEVFGYSSTSNVIHLILDSFQTDVFLELMDEQGWHDEFDGFVLFEDNLSIASQTSLAVPAIMSGLPYDGTTDTEEYFRRAVEQGSITNKLVHAGYMVNMISYISLQAGAHTNYMRTPIDHGIPRHQQRTREAAFAVDVAWFRAVPHVLRRTVYNDGDWQLVRRLAQSPSARSFHHKAFLRDYIDLLSPVTAAPAYHFMHLMPPHPPYATLADGSFAGETLPYTRENHLHEARAILAMFLSWMERLRELGLYDSSLIVLQGDHGTDHEATWNGNAVVLPVGRAAGLLAVKRVGAKGPLQRSTVATSTADVAATLMAELRQPAAPGVSVFERTEEGAQRARSFYTYLQSGESLSRFDVRGNVFDATAWSGPFLGEKVALSRKYDWGSFVTFGAGGNAESYVGDGWSSSMSAEHRWTSGSRALLHFEVEPTQENVMLKFLFAPFVDEVNAPQQRVVVLCDGHEISRFTATEHKAAVMTLKLVPGLFDDGEFTLEFQLPDAVSPRSVGRGGDERRLGIFLARLVMYPESKPPPGVGG